MSLKTNTVYRFQHTTDQLMLFKDPSIAEDIWRGYPHYILPMTKNTGNYLFCEYIDLAHAVALQ